MGRAMPRMVALGSIKTQTEQAKEDRALSSPPSQILLQLLPPGSCLVSVPSLISFDDDL